MEYQTDEMKYQDKTQKKTTLGISYGVKVQLSKIKVHPRQTYDELLMMLIKEHQEIDKDVGDEDNLKNEDLIDVCEKED